MKKFLISNTNKIVFPKDVRHPVVMELLRNFTPGINWEISHTAPAHCIFIGDATAADRMDEEYVLNITESGAYIQGRDYPSMMRGFVTFLDNVFCKDRKVFYADCGTVRGTANMEFRSVHICVFPEMDRDFVRKCLRLSAMAKYSHVILEFWGMLKLDSMKELAWPFAYTKDDVRELVQEANALGMEIVPFFQHLGHASLCRLGASGKHVVLDQNPEYEYLYMQNSYGWVWDFTREDVRALLRAVRAELMDVCGKGRYFHLGCDEAPTVAGEMSKELCDYLNGVAAELESAGRRAMVWGDMLLSHDYFKDAPRRAPGNNTSIYEANSTKEFADAITDMLDKKIIIADWEYNVQDEVWRSAKLFRDKGFDVICSTFSDLENIHSAVKTVRELGVQGMMKTTWHMLYKEVPRLYYAGVCMWEGLTDDNSHDYFGFMCEKTSQFFRKVGNAQGDYEKCGWFDKQISPGL